jgi:hypothetical protein
MPALFTLIYVGGFAFVILLLLIGLVRNRRRPVTTAAIPEDLPKEVRKRLGSTSTNRGLRALRWFFILLSIGLFGFHIYWANYASEKNEKFQQLSYKDLRVRRLSESTLRGWLLDRSGRLDQPLAYYKRNSSGEIRREYPMDCRTCLAPIEAIRVWNGRCLVRKVGRFLKRCKLSEASRLNSKAIRMYG